MLTFEATIIYFLLNIRKACSPDFLCERLAGIFLATEDSSYVMKARKRRITSEHSDHHLEAIELTFSDLRPIDERVGSHFAEWATKGNL